MKIQFSIENTQATNQVYEKLLDASAKVHTNQSEEELSSLSKDQQKLIFDILKEVDLSTAELRKNLVRRIESDPKITRVIHLAIASREKTQDDYLLFDEELTRSCIDALQYINIGMIGAVQQKDEIELTRDWWNKYSALFDKPTLQLLGTDDLYHLTSLLPIISSLELSKYQTLLQNLPEQGKKYYETLELGLSEFWKKICEIHPSPSDDRFIALSHYISSKQIAFSEIQTLLCSDDLSRLLPHLRFGDFEGVSDEVITSTLTNATRLQYVKISSLSITTLPELPLCKKLYCYCCLSLKTLPELPLCQELNCSSCPSLAALPELPLCQHLDCSRCPSLVALPELPLCQTLYCSHCSALTALPELPLCQTLDCSRCSSLAALPELTVCQELNCSDCSALAALPELPTCERINCSGCTNLQELPQALPACQVLNCEDCPSLPDTMPELPWNALVYSNLQFTKLEVDLDELTSNPRKLLLELGSHLLQNKPFPNIYYRLKGELSEAVDIGGVRRDFISRLMESLFAESSMIGKLVIDHEKFPQLKQSNEKEDIDCYRTIGRIFVLCYPQVSYFKTGTLFSAGVYQKIALLADPSLATLDIASDKNIVPTYLHYRNFAGFLKLIDGKDDNIQDVEDGVLIAAYTFIGMGGDAEEARGYFKKQDSRKLLEKEVIEAAQLDPQFQAIRLIAQEVKNKIGADNLNLLRQEKPNKIQERIEGVLSKEILLSKLHWEETASHTSLDPQLKAKTKGYLKSWIERASPDDLRKFVRAVTSNNTLGPNLLKIEIYNRGPEFIPVAHTCFFTLELSAEYVDQETFDKKINLLLTEGMAGSGFQVA